MRLALISDIHGNVPALEAVLADARGEGVEQHWFLGDFAAIGPEPGAALEVVTAVSGARWCRGNTDRYVVTGERPHPTLAAVLADPSLASTYAGIAASFAWTQGFLAAEGWLQWLEQLPLDIRWTAPNGLEVLAVHASPGTDDGEGIHAGRSNADLAQLIAGHGARAVFVGHTHETLVRPVGDVLVVNVGSVSNPTSPDLRASYVVLHATESGIEIEHRRIAYDHDDFIQRVVGSRHPATDFILRFQRGEHAPRAPHPDHEAVRVGMRVRWP